MLDTPAVVMMSFPPYGGPAWSPRVVFLVARTLVVGFGIDVACHKSGPLLVARPQRPACLPR